MKKLLKTLALLAMSACTAFAVAACGEANDGDGTTGGGEIVDVGVAPEITNVPANNMLAIKNDSNTYQFTIAQHEGKVRWTSTVETVATINADGLLTMLKGGETIIIVTDVQSGKTDSFALTVVDEREKETLTITGMPETVRVGDEAITLGVSSSTGSAVSATFTSSNPAVGEITEAGVFTPKAKGVTTITAVKSGDSSVKTMLTVEVVGVAISGVSITNFPKYGLLVGDSYALATIGSPENCEDYEIEWSVDDTSIAVIDGNANVIGVSKGTCTVTATVKGTDIKEEKTLEVAALSKTSEDFRFATVGTGNVQNVGPTITMNNVDGEIVEYGEDQALKISTRANGAYNNFTVNFGELEAGNYKLTMTYKVLDGRHSGAMVKDSDTGEFGYVMAATALGNDEYTFYFNQETAGVKKIAFSAQQWNMKGEVLVDNIKLEKVDEIPQGVSAGAIQDGTFDDVTLINGQSCDIGGVYITPRKLMAELVDDNNGGRALKVTRAEGGYAYIALSLGNIKAGNYTLTMDIQDTDYQGILQVLQINNENGLWKTSTFQEVKYDDNDTVFELAKKNGNTYTLTFSVAEDIENCAIALSTNLNECNGESIIIDNISIGEAPVAQSYDFETERLPVKTNENGFGKVDFATCIATTGTLITTHGSDYVTEDGNTYYKVNFKGWDSMSMFNFGTLAAGKYAIKMDAKLLSGTMEGRFVYRANGTEINLTEENYSKVGDTYTFIIDLATAASEFAIGYRSISAQNADFSVGFDNISIAEYVYVAPTGVEITTKPQTTLTSKEPFAFGATVAPANATSYSLVWSVDDTAVGEIDEATGVFTVKKSGTCNVTVAILGTEFSHTVAVVVELPPVVAERVEITSAPSSQLSIGATFAFVATVSPADAENYTLVWSVDDTNVGEIDEATGVFTAKAKGECNVTVTLKDTDISYTVKVTVAQEDGTSSDKYDGWEEEAVQP